MLKAGLDVALKAPDIILVALACIACSISSVLLV
jgi:hypothetical protein